MYYDLVMLWNSSSYHATFFFSLSVNLLASCQVEPDPEFPVVRSPNPEEGKSALVSTAYFIQAWAVVTCATF